MRDRTGYDVLGSTLDDAAGEAFDKGARLLGLGYPGGAEIDRLAREGDPEAFSFPVARVPGLDLSFSGLKTALLYAVRDLSEAELAARRADLAASYQRAIVRALVGRLHAAAEQTGDGTIAVVGGVAANSELRAALPDARFAPLALCTDNAAMIASAARFARSIESPGYLALDAYASRLGARSARSRSLCVLALGGAAGAADGPPVGAAGWQGLLGSRPTPQLGGRWIVVLRAPSLADRVRRAGGARPSCRCAPGRRPREAHSGARSRGSWSRGAPVDPEQSYVRVLNGFAGVDRPELPARRSSATPRSPASTPCAPRTPRRSRARRSTPRRSAPASGRRVGLEHRRASTARA